MLKIGDEIAVVSLSRGVLGEPFAKHQLNLGLNRLKAFGLKPICMPNALKGLKELDQHPEERAEDLKTAFADPKIKGIVCAIGGDDTYRLLPYLLTDNDFIKNVRTHPKIFTGFSDTTINHLMFYKLGLETFYGPNFLNDLAELDKTMLPYTYHSFSQFFQVNETTSIKSSRYWYDERTDFSSHALNTPRIRHNENAGYQVLRGTGHFTGRLLGGCLDSLYDCLTTNRYPDEAEIIQKYHIFPSTAEWQNKILFIETSEECPDPGLFERMLLKLKEKGVLAAINGIIVGKPQNNNYFEAYQTKLLAVTDDLQTPILYNVNFGHAYPRTVIPYGEMADVNLDHLEITLIEPFLALKSH